MAPKKTAAKSAAKPRARRRVTKAEPADIERVGGSTVPVHGRLWAHRHVDHVIADERALGSARRPPAVTE